ncbi:hypothetical protein A3747_03785 [Sulfitobacter sp. HI0076]|nr:hypothetical protein A3722_16850 [Sulfitobacter sp. HI0027]KZX96712.1 hypothetical protein A3720_19485 [Sulfitobacter sp. HI0021]KZZ01256.1 hypothetical protein A3747_03785 [Sulfitobacter sp. HI0076]
MHTVLLTTVNAPYQTYLDGRALAATLNAGDITKGQVNSFFTETDAGAQKAFAKAHGVSEDTLVKTAAAFAKWSGQKIALLA